MILSFPMIEENKDEGVSVMRYGPEHGKAATTN